MHCWVRSLWYIWHVIVYSYSSEWRGVDGGTTYTYIWIHMNTYTYIYTYISIHKYPYTFMYIHIHTNVASVQGRLHFSTARVGPLTSHSQSLAMESTSSTSEEAAPTSRQAVPTLQAVRLCSWHELSLPDTPWVGISNRPERLIEPHQLVFLPPHHHVWLNGEVPSCVVPKLK